MLYLVDSENIPKDWTVLLKRAKKCDEFYVFYTDSNAWEKAFSKSQQKNTKAKIKTIECGVGKPGKSALDFQLSSFLGYIAMKHKDEKIAIVSSDMGYDPLITFWKDKKIKVVRINTKKNAAAKSMEQKNSHEDSTQELNDTVFCICTNNQPCEIPLCDVAKLPREKKPLETANKVAAACGLQNPDIGSIAVNIYTMYMQQKTEYEFVKCINLIKPSKNTKRWYSRATLLKKNAKQILALCTE